MDAEMKRMETGEMLKRLKKKKHPKRAVLPAASRTVFEEFVVHAMDGKKIILRNKKAKPAAVELACSFAKWAVNDKHFSVSHACDYIPFLYHAVLEDWPEVIVGIPDPRRLRDLKKGCKLLLGEKHDLIEALKFESNFIAVWKELEETADSPVPALPQDVKRLIEVCGPTPYGQRMAAFMCAVFESRFSVTQW
jgi:hypothetical protein